jgi:hypothetical protein
MEPPEPDASDELIHYLDDAATSAKEWYEISAALFQHEQETSDIQAGWLMTAFDYHLARRVGEERNRTDTFGEKMSGPGGTYPTPVEHVPEEVIALWASTAEQVGTSAARARLHHLLFERGHGNSGTHGREAAAEYLTLGTGSWSRLERANCLHWAVDLFKKVGDRQEAVRVYPALVALATESMDQEKREPGVALHALEVLAYGDGTTPELPALLERAREVYGDDPWLTGHTVRIQEQVFRSDPSKREHLRRDAVEAFFKHADKFPRGFMRMAFLEDAAKLANRFGFPDLSEKASAAMQEISKDDLDLKTVSASVSIPAEVVDTHVAALVEQDTLAQALEGLASAEPPTGNVDTNLANTKEVAEQTPFASLIPTKIVGGDGLARYTATSDDDRFDEQLARVEGISLSIGGEVTARVLEGILERFSPSESDLIGALEGLPHVSLPFARSLARAILSFQTERYEEATTVAMPRIESLVRALCREKGVLRFRVQRDQRQGPSTRGQFPQLGTLLTQIKPWFDPSWYRFLWTFLVSPFGLNYRNELLHGYTEEVTRIPSALTILAGLRLALIPVSADPATDVPGPDESASSASPK